jgi:hypothetical protein
MELLTNSPIHESKEYQRATNSVNNLVEKRAKGLSLSWDSLFCFFILFYFIFLTR